MGAGGVGSEVCGADGTRGTRHCEQRPAGGAAWAPGSCDLPAGDDDSGAYLLMLHALAQSTQPGNGS